MILLLAPLTIVFSLLSERERIDAVETVDKSLSDALFGPPAHRALVLMDEDAAISSWWSPSIWDEQPATKLSPGWSDELRAYLRDIDLPEGWKSLLTRMCDQAHKHGGACRYHDPVETIHPHRLMYESLADLEDASDRDTWAELEPSRRMFVRATSLLERFVPGIRFHGGAGTSHMKTWWSAQEGLTLESRKDPFLESFPFPVWTDGEYVLVMEPWMGECLELRPELDEACSVAWNAKDLREVVRVMLAEARTREEEKGLNRPIAELWIPTCSSADHIFLQISVYRVPSHAIR